MTQFQSFVTKLGHIFLAYGALGLFLMSFLDSSFVPFPFLNDLSLMLLASQHPYRAPLYALASTTGSVAGCYLLYALSRRGRKFLLRKALPHSIARAEHWIKQNDFVALLVLSLLPPPAPLKIFVLTAGVLQVNRGHFIGAMLAGRGLRFAAAAWLGAKYGPQAQAFLKANVGWVSLIAVVVILGFTFVYRAWKRRQARSKPESTGPHPGSPLP